MFVVLALIAVFISLILFKPLSYNCNDLYKSSGSHNLIIIILIISIIK